MSSSAEVAIDLQTRHIDACAIEGLVGTGKPVMENCSFTGTFKALNCDCCQAASVFSNPVYLTHMARTLHPTQAELDASLPAPLIAPYDVLEVVFK